MPEWQRRCWNMLVGLDRALGQLLTLGGIYPDESISGCAYRVEQRGKIMGRIFRPLIDALLFFDKDHCKTAFENERQRKYSPPQEQHPT